MGRLVLLKRFEKFAMPLYPCRSRQTHAGQLAFDASRDPVGGAHCVNRMLVEFGHQPQVGFPVHPFGLVTNWTGNTAAPAQPRPDLVGSGIAL